jgi:hypothetical protein
VRRVMAATTPIAAATRSTDRCIRTMFQREPAPGVETGPTASASTIEAHVRTTAGSALGEYG